MKKLDIYGGCFDRYEEEKNETQEVAEFNSQIWRVVYENGDIQDFNVDVYKDRIEFADDFTIHANSIEEAIEEIKIVIPHAYKVFVFSLIYVKEIEDELK